MLTLTIIMLSTLTQSQVGLCSPATARTVMAGGVMSLRVAA